MALPVYQEAAEKVCALLGDMPNVEAQVIAPPGGNCCAVRLHYSKDGRDSWFDELVDFDSFHSANVAEAMRHAFRNQLISEGIL